MPGANAGFEVNVTGYCEAAIGIVFKFIEDGNLFELTGADRISFDFMTNGSFSLGFINRGTISGRLTDIIPDAGVIMQWNVNGFDRDPEVNTIVKIMLTSMEEERTKIDILHSGIQTEASRLAKKKAWEAIISDLKVQISNK